MQTDKMDIYPHWIDLFFEKEPVHAILATYVMQQVVTVLSSEFLENADKLYSDCDCVMYRQCSCTRHAYRMSKARLLISVAMKHFEKSDVDEGIKKEVNIAVGNFYIATSNKKPAEELCKFMDIIKFHCNC